MQPPNISIGGTGGIYLLPEPGELVVEVHKRDRNETQRATDLRAILIGPDRRHLDEAIIEGNDSARLTTVVEHKGVYVVNVTAAYDRYGEHVWWGFRTNCPKYLIETSRGHKDARHREPIELAPDSGLFDICFLPREAEVGIDLSGLPDGSAPVLFDGSDERLVGFDVSTDGNASVTVPAALRKPCLPWRLHLPAGASTVEIDGVTRWDHGERFADLSLWSPDRDSFFPFHDLRWALTPYAYAWRARPEMRHEIALRLHNNGGLPDSLSLAVDGAACDVTLSQTQIELAPGATQSITAAVTVPADARPGDRLSMRIAVTSSRHPRFTTWSTLEARVDTGASPLLDMPIVYRPYAHENEQFGYTPDYPNHNQIYFDPDNRPIVRSGDGLHHLNQGRWEWMDTVKDTRFRAVGSKVAFGGDGEICLLAASDEGVSYLYSRNGGASFTAAAGPAHKARRQQSDIEQFAGHNLPAGPAPFLLASETGDYDPKHFWRHVNDLDLFLPHLEGDRLVIGEPILVSRQAIGISSHSGIPSALASRGDRVHVIWGEATDPDGDAPGVPAYVATWDRSEGRWLGEPALVGYGPPANDVHNTPSFVIDSEGYLHTLTGTHGQPFAYARSLAPNTAHEGFTDPAPMEQDLRSTYLGLVCDPDDTLHLLFRSWTDDGVYHPHSHYANLAYKRKPKGGDWEPMRRLAVAPFSEYGIWYHRLTIDRRGRLLVSFDVWSTFWFYRTDHIGHRRKTIMSPDGGDTWQLLMTEDL